MFHVGQMVVCITSFPHTPNKYVPRYPKKGEVFTILEIYDHPTHPEGLLGFYFEEIICGTHPTYNMEYGFGSDSFRPVKKTSIDLFNEIALKTSNNTPVLEPV